MEFYVDKVDNSVYNSVFLKKREFRMWITFLKKMIFLCFFVRDFVALCILLNSSARTITAWAELLNRAARPIAAWAELLSGTPDIQNPPYPTFGYGGGSSLEDSSHRKDCLVIGG